MLDTVTDITMQRAKGRAELGFNAPGGRTHLCHLHQSGCLKIMLPRNHADIPDAVLINTAGGLTGGDALSAHIALEDRAALRLATQTAERIYKSTGAAATVDYLFELGAGAALDWLAQETILFQSGSVRRKISVEMDATASLLLVEPIVFGRVSMGEVVTDADLHDTWRIKRGGELVFADDTRIIDFEALRMPAAAGDAQAVATVLFVDPAAELMVDALRALPQDGIEMGVSAWNDLLTIRLLAVDSFDLRQRLEAVIETLRGRALPRVWTM